MTIDFQLDEYHDRLEDFPEEDEDVNSDDDNNSAPPITKIVPNKLQGKPSKWKWWTFKSCQIRRLLSYRFTLRDTTQNMERGLIEHSHPFRISILRKRVRRYEIIAGTNRRMKERERERENWCFSRAILNNFRRIRVHECDTRLACTKQIKKKEGEKAEKT